MSSNILPFLAWTFLPDLVTQYTQPILYALLIRAGEPRPQPGTPRFLRDRHRIHLTILTLYFAYTLYEAHWDLRRAGSLYSLLDLPADSPDKAISSRFRRLTLQHHPDKAAATDSPSDAYFIALTTARDTLVDPNKRFAYDRFGPDVLSWQHAHTIRDYVTLGLQSTVLPYYLGSAVVLAVFQWLGWFTTGVYWRWWGFATLGAFEVACVTRPTFPHEWIGDNLPGWLRSAVAVYVGALGSQPYLPFQVVAYARRAALTFFIGLSRVGPLLAQLRAVSGSLTAESAAASAEMDEEVRVDRLLGRLGQMVAASGTEAARLLALEGIPFAPSTVDSVVEVRRGEEGGGMVELKRGVKEWMMRNAVKGDRDVVGATARAVKRRNGEVVSGVIELDEDDVEREKVD